MVKKGTNTEPSEDEKVNEEVEEENEEVEEESPAPESEETEEAAGPKTFDELKVVIIMKKENVMVGVQSPGCDPVYETLQGTLATALGMVVELVDTAKQRWTENPQYPKADLPEPPPAASTSTTSRSSTKEKKEQPSFF
jgi:hypothetical protein